VALHWSLVGLLAASRGRQQKLLTFATESQWYARRDGFG
jgi:hypothetical protein